MIRDRRTPEELDRELDRERVRVQVGVIRHAYDGNVAVASESDDDGDVLFLYDPRHVLTRTEDTERLQTFFADRQDTYRGTGDVSGEPVEGLAVYELPTLYATGQADVLATLEEIDGDLGAGVATPDHVIYVTRAVGSICPATEPELPPDDQPVPARSQDATAGEGVQISVVDTGWYAAAQNDPDTPWLAGVDGDQENVDPLHIGPYAGHGTFVAGVVRCLAPAAPIRIEGFLTKGGAVYESEIARQLNEAFTKNPETDLVSISAGTHTRNDIALLSFVALAKAYDLVKGEKAPLVVAAAGNDGNAAPFWPAAFDWVVAVGALDPNGKVCDFSNAGPWVDVYALGRNLVNAFPTGRYTCYEPAHQGEVRTFSGLAQWSGTSFSTPVVTGAIAAYLSANKVTVRQARDAVLKAGKPLQDPRAGAFFAVGPPFS